MRYTLLIFCSLIVQTVMAQSANKQEKTVTLILSNISLEEALTIIGVSYGVEFSYSDDVVPTGTIVNLNVKDETLDPVLENLLGPFGLTAKRTTSDRIVVRKLHRGLTQTVRGTVSDLVTGTPIPGATVLIAGSDPLVGTTTDDHGVFRIDSVTVGRPSLIVSSIGYDTRTINGLLLTSGKELVVDIELAESVMAMQEVVVTGRKNEGVPGDGVALTSGREFSVEDTKRYAGSMGDPARMASGFAGVTGGSDVNNALVVRGNSPRGVLWRVEGIEVPNPNHFTTEGASHGVVSILSPNVIDNSDFLTGAFPAQYGNALSAVFDIHLRNGNNEKREYAVQAGLLGLEASAEGPFSENHAASYLVNYRYSTLSILDKLGFDLNQAGEYMDYQDMAFKMHLPTDAGTFSLFGIGGHSKSNLSDTTLFDNNASGLGVLAMAYRKVIRGHTVVNSSVSYARTEISNYNEVETSDTDLLALDESYSKAYSRFSLTARRKVNHAFYAEGGITLSRLDYNFFLKNVDTQNPAYQVIVNFSERDHSYITQGFLYARQYFSRGWFAFYGIHFLHLAFTRDASLEPRMGVRWQPSPARSLSLAIGKHSRIENLQYYLARDHQPGGSDVQFNRNLGFTRANHLVMSYEQAFRSTHKLRIETYYQHLYNAPVQNDPASYYAAINEETGFITDSLINNGKGKNYGIEISMERSFSGNMYYLINGSLFRSVFSMHDQPYRSTAYNGNYSLHLLAGRELPLRSRDARLGLNLKVTSAGGRPYIPIDLNQSVIEGRQVHNWEDAFTRRLPDYFRTDFQLVYRQNRRRYSVEWRLDVQNITHHQNPEHYYYDAQNQVIRLKKQIGIIPLITYRLEF